MSNLAVWTCEEADDETQQARDGVKCKVVIRTVRRPGEYNRMGRNRLMNMKKLLRNKQAET